MNTIWWLFLFIILLWCQWKIFKTKTFIPGWVVKFGKWTLLGGLGPGGSSAFGDKDECIDAICLLCTPLFGDIRQYFSKALEEQERWNDVQRYIKTMLLRLLWWYINFCSNDSEGAEIGRTPGEKEYLVWNIYAIHCPTTSPSYTSWQLYYKKSMILGNLEIFGLKYICHRST